MGGTPGEQNRLAVHLRQRHRRNSTEITALACLGMLDCVGLDVSDPYALAWHPMVGQCKGFLSPIPPPHHPAHRIMLSSDLPLREL